MVVRLAFAVAVHVDPEVLLVDEALAVGDTYFRHKCMRKVHELRARGHHHRLRLSLVSGHSWPSATASSGSIMAAWSELGEAGPVLDRYLAAMSNRGESREARARMPESCRRSSGEPVATIPNIDQRHGDRPRPHSGHRHPQNEYAEPLHLMFPDSRLLVRITIRAEHGITRPVAGFVLRNHLGFDFAETSSVLPVLAAGELRTVDFLIELPEFYPGAFSFSPWVGEDWPK